MMNALRLPKAFGGCSRRARGRSRPSPTNWRGRANAGCWTADGKLRPTLQGRRFSERVAAGVSQRTERNRPARLTGLHAPLTMHHCMQTESDVAALTIRNVDDATKARLRVRSAQHVSMKKRHGASCARPVARRHTRATQATLARSACQRGQRGNSSCTHRQQPSATRLGCRGDLCSTPMSSRVHAPTAIGSSRCWLDQQSRPRAAYQRHQP